MKKAYLPAITIITVILTLLVILLINTKNNLDMQMKTMEQALLEKGEIIFRTVDAFINATGPNNKDFNKELSMLAQNINHDRDVLHLFIVNSLGEEVLHSHGDGTINVKNHQTIIKQSLNEGKALVIDTDQNLMEIGRSLPSGYIIDIGLSMKRIYSARNKDISHAIFMGIILLVLGTSAIYFIFVAQNYYVVKRSLERMSSFLEDVVNSMPGALISVDRTGKIVTVNKAAEILLKLDMNHVGNKQIEEILNPEDTKVHEILTRQEKALEVDGEAIREEDGEKVPISVSASIVHDEAGENIGSVFILRDMRELRSCQAQLIRSEKLAMAGTLSMAIAHEIRNPLSSLRGFVHYFKQHFSSPSKEMEYLHLMISEIDRVNATITDLLNLSRPKPPVYKIGSVNAAIERAATVMGANAVEKKINLSIDTDDEISNIPFDGEMLHQALLNLLINAVDATPHGGNIEVTSSQDKEKRKARIEIKDSGGGIDEDLLPRIFDPFTSGKEEGTGLGLAVVQQVVDLHGWEIDVWSEKLMGTTFMIEIPLLMGESALAREQSS